MNFNAFFHKNVLLLAFLILMALVIGSECNTLRDMITKTIKKRQETTGGMQENYTKLLPPGFSEIFLRRHFRK